MQTIHKMINFNKTTENYSHFFLRFHLNWMSRVKFNREYQSTWPNEVISMRNYFADRLGKSKLEKDKNVSNRLNDVDGRMQIVRVFFLLHLIRPLAVSFLPQIPNVRSKRSRTTKQSDLFWESWDSLFSASLLVRCRLERYMIVQNSKVDKFPLRVFVSESDWNECYSHSHRM